MKLHTQHTHMQQTYLKVVCNMMAVLGKQQQMYESGDWCGPRTQQAPQDYQRARPFIN